MPRRATDRECVRKSPDGGEGDRGERVHPGEGSRTSDKKTTAAENPCFSRILGGGPAPAAGLEPATRRLTAVCSTN